MLINKEQKTKILDCMEDWCGSSKISKKTLGLTMRSYHISCPFIVMMFLFYGSQLAVSFAFFNLISVLFCFFMFNGCILTMLEHRLCGDEFTIADPFIELLDLELNSRNRMLISYCIAIGYLAFFMIVYYYRFYCK